MKPAGSPNAITYSPGVARTLRAWIEKHAADKVYDVDKSGGFSFEPDGVGYDVGIRPGWSLGPAYDHAHTCIERTAADVIAALKTLQRCDRDDECRAANAAAKE